MSPISFPDEGVENYVKLGLEHNPNMRFIIQLSWGGGEMVGPMVVKASIIPDESGLAS